MAAGCVSEELQYHMCRRIEDCRGWWLSGCRSSVAEYCSAEIVGNGCLLVVAWWQSTAVLIIMTTGEYTG